MVGRYVAPTPNKFVPVKVVAVIFETDTGAFVKYPVSPPVVVTKAPKTIDIIGDRAYLNRE